MKLAWLKAPKAEKRLKTADMLNGWTVGTVDVYLRREGDIVTMEVPGLSLDGTNATNDSFAVIPAGFRPNYSGGYGSVGVVAETVTLNLVSVTRNNNAGTFDLRCKSRKPVSGILRWYTSDSMDLASPPPAS